MTDEPTRKRRRGHGDGTIFQRENGTWCAQVRTEGGKRISKTFPTRREARDWLTEAMKAKQDGMLTDNRQITLGQFLDRWLQDVVKQSTRARTFESYTGLVRVHIQPALGAIKLSNLRPDHLQGFYVEKANSGLSPRTVRYLHAVLHRALEQALQWGMVPRNVADVAKPPRLVRHEMKIFSPDEARRFLDGIKDDPLHPLYIVAITTGMRQGEILGLHWAEVDLEKEMIRVTRALQRIRTQGLILTEPKSEKGRRSIALPPLTVEALRQHRARQAADKVLMGSAWEDHDLVFISSKGTPLDPRNLVRHFKDTLQELGLPEIRFHDLRHTAATLLLAQGIHPKIVQEMLGHSSITLTLDTYSHVLPSMQREAAAQMEAILKDGKNGAQVFVDSSVGTKEPIGVSVAEEADD